MPVLKSSLPPVTCLAQSFSGPTGSILIAGLALLVVTACSGPPDQESSGSAGGSGEAAGTSKAETPPASISRVDSLSESQWEKLDHAMRLLLREGPNNPFFTYQTRPREGDTTYAVLIRTSDPGALAQEDLPLGEPSGSIVTARLTAEEIRRAARLEPVVSISNPSEAELH